MILCHPERSQLKNQNIYSKNRLYNHNHQNPDIFRGCYRPLVHGSAVKADKWLAAGRAIRSLKITLGTFSGSCLMKSVIYDLSIYVLYIKYQDISSISSMDLSPPQQQGASSVDCHGLFLYQGLNSSDSLQPSGVLRKDKWSNFSILKSGFRTFMIC